MPEKLSIEVSVENSEALAKLAETDAAIDKVANKKRSTASSKSLQQQDKDLQKLAVSAKKADTELSKMHKNEEKATTARAARNRQVLSPHQEMDKAIREISRRRSALGELTPGGGAGQGGVGGGGGAVPVLPMPTAIPDITGEAKKATRRMKEATEAAQKVYAPLPMRGPGGRMMSMKPEAVLARSLAMSGGGGEGFVSPAALEHPMSGLSELQPRSPGFGITHAETLRFAKQLKQRGLLTAKAPGLLSPLNAVFSNQLQEGLALTSAGGVTGGGGGAIKTAGTVAEGAGRKAKAATSDFDKFFKKLGDKSWKKFVNDIGALLKGMFSLGPAMMKFTLSFAKLGAIASVAGGAIGTFIAAIGPTSAGIAGLFVGALSAIPGVLAGIGVSAGAGFLGMYKLKGAFSALGEQMALGPLSGIGERRQAYTDMVNAMSKLTPSGRAFFKYIEGLVPLYKSLAKQTQGLLLPKIETGLKIAMPTLQNNLIPFLERAATGIGNLFIQWAKFSSSVKGSGEMRTIFKSAGDFMSTMGDNLIGLIKDFAALGSSVGVKALHSLGATLHNANIEFGHFISAGHAMKLFDDWTKGFDKFHASIRRIWPTLHQLGAEFMSAYKVLSPLLGIGGHVFASLIKNLSGPINQLLKGVGSAIRPLGQALTMAFSGLFKGLGNKGMSTMFKELGQAFLLIGKLLKEVLPVLGPALVKVLGMVLKGITPLVSMFGKVFVTAISDLLKVLVKTWPAFQNVLNAILPLIPNLMNLTMKAIIPLINPLDQLVLALLQLANQVLIPIIPSLSTFLNLTMRLVTPLVGMVTQLAKIPGFAPALLAIFAAWKVSKFLQFSSGATSIVSKLLGLVGARSASGALGVPTFTSAGIGGSIISGAAALAIGYTIGDALNSKFHWSKYLSNWIGAADKARIQEGYLTAAVLENTGELKKIHGKAVFHGTHAQVVAHEAQGTITGLWKILGKEDWKSQLQNAKLSIQAEDRGLGKKVGLNQISNTQAISWMNRFGNSTQNLIAAQLAEIVAQRKLIAQVTVANTSRPTPSMGTSVGSPAYLRAMAAVNIYIDSNLPKPKPDKRVSPNEAVRLILLHSGGWGGLP